MYAFSTGRQDISGGTAPIEDLARLETWGQVLSSSRLVGMEDTQTGQTSGGSFSTGQ